MTSGLAKMMAGLIPAPTETKYSPSSRPLNGSIVTSISRRYSVSASRSPATKAPSAIDRRLAAAARPSPSTTSKQAAMKNSGLFVSATKWKNGLSARRPSTMSAANAKRGRNERLEELCPEAALAARCERPRHDEERSDREILEQEHREARTADRRAEPLALDEHRNDDRGRRHAERGGDGQRGPLAPGQGPWPGRSATSMVTTT